MNSAQVTCFKDSPCNRGTVRRSEPWPLWLFSGDNQTRGRQSARVTAQTIWASVQSEESSARKEKRSPCSQADRSTYKKTPPHPYPRRSRTCGHKEMLMAPGITLYYCEPLTQSPGGPDPTPRSLKAEGFLQLAETARDSKPGRPEDRRTRNKRRGWFKAAERPQLAASKKSGTSVLQPRGRITP